MRGPHAVLSSPTLDLPQLESLEDLKAHDIRFVIPGHGRAGAFESADAFRAAVDELCARERAAAAADPSLRDRANFDPAAWQ